MVVPDEAGGAMMSRFCKKPVTVEAWQFFYSGPTVPGVFYPSVSDDGKTYIGDAYVITIHGQAAYLSDGDWVVTEPDGDHHYPVKPEIFCSSYQPIDDDGNVMEWE